MYYGIDGCPAGWIVIGIDSANDYRVEMAEQFADLCGLIAASSLTLIDMPIGLPSRAIPDRLCDRAARKLLGRRSSSVFPVPSRAAVTANDYEAACAVNTRELGKKISKQSWNIAGRIAEIDAAIADGLSQRRLREMHPEVAFAALNGGMPMTESKKTAAGRAQRIAVLERWLPSARTIQALTRARFPLKSRLADDDILDALVGAVTAAHKHSLATLPEQPIRDDRGLLMEIVYSRMAYDG